MKLLVFCILGLISIVTSGQVKDEKILYVVDSIPIFQDITEEEGDLSEKYIDHLNVVTNKADFGYYKIYDFDKIIFVFTKEYTKRPDEIKQIPSFVNKLYKHEGKWCLGGSTVPYTGRYIDYYFTGLKKEEGFLKDGMDDGVRYKYYKDGTLRVSMVYLNGKQNGEFIKYFPNGQIQLKGKYKNDVKEENWEEWYSTGELKQVTIYKSGKQKLSDIDNKVNAYFTKGLSLFEKGKYQEAVIYYTKAIDLNSNLSEIYFHRSRAFLYDFKFDESIIDCDKAIELEPLYKDAYSNRAFVRIRKYECKDGRTLFQNKEITVFTTPTTIDIQTDDKIKICSDLKKGYELGDTIPMIKEAIKKYCE